MGSVMRRVPDNSKAKKLLGWSPKVSFEEGILDFLNSL
jgi:nucleoside-diphosphate-sugar epimerase